MCRFLNSSAIKRIKADKTHLYFHFHFSVLTLTSCRFTSARAKHRQQCTPMGKLCTLNRPIRAHALLKLCYNGQWGSSTICYHGWDITDTNVVCKQLGFPKASRVFSGATHGHGTGPIWLGDVACSGSESHIYDCQHRGWGNNNCSHSQDPSVECSAVRLVNGGAYCGRVEVNLNGIWSTVCDDYWDMNDANVVCRQLGLSSAASTPHGAAYGQGSGYIWIDDVNSQGGDASPFDYAHYPTWSKSYRCSHTEDASVVCNT